jgi:hypothetical protein
MTSVQEETNRKDVHSGNDNPTKPNTRKTDME